MKASANVPAAPVCTVRLQRPWCCVASAVSLVEAKRPCIRIETSTRVMLVVDGTGNAQQRRRPYGTRSCTSTYCTSAVVGTSRPAHIIFGVVERLVGPGLAWLGGESRYTRWSAQRSSAISHGPMLPMAEETNAPFSCSLPFNAFLSEPQLAGTSAAGMSDALRCCCCC